MRRNRTLCGMLRARVTAAAVTRKIVHAAACTIFLCPPCYFAHRPREITRKTPADGGSGFRKGASPLSGTPALRGGIRNALRELTRRRARRRGGIQQSRVKTKRAAMPLEFSDLNDIAVGRPSATGESFRHGANRIIPWPGSCRQSASPKRPGAHPAAAGYRCRIKARAG